jgi:hypothetical protein
MIHSPRSMQNASCAEQSFCGVPVERLGPAPIRKPSSTCLASLELGLSFSSTGPATLSGTYADAPLLTGGRKQSGGTQGQTQPYRPDKRVKTLSIELGGGGIGRRAPLKRSAARRHDHRKPKRVTFTQENSNAGSNPALPVRCSSFTSLFLLTFAELRRSGDLRGASAFSFFGFLFLLRLS